MIQTESQTRRERGGLTVFDVRLLRFARYVVLVGAFWFAATGLLPFRPYVIQGYRAIPPSGCAAQVIQLHLIRDATKPFLGWIGRVDLDIRWQNMDTGKTLLSVSASDVFNGNYGYDEDAVGILAIAPDEIGTWRIITVATIKGVKLLMPNGQTYAHASDQVYTLLPKNNETCQEAEGG